MKVLGIYTKRLLQKGQAIVEFAMILPVFLMLSFGTLYGGMMMSDYLALKNFAGNVSKLAARDYDKVFNANGTIKDSEDNITTLKERLGLMTCTKDGLAISATEKSDGNIPDVITITVSATFKDNFPKIIESLAPKDKKYTVTATSINEKGE